MRLYYEIARRSFRRAAAYRSAYFFGLLTNAFFGALLTFMYRAFYAAGGGVVGWTVEDAVSYTWTTQSLISIGGGWLSYEIMGTIKTGEVVTDLSRPWNYFGYWLSRTLGERLYNLMLRASLTYLVGIAFFGARIPTVGNAAAFLVAMTLAVLVAFAFSFIVNLSSFWLVDATGIMFIASIALMFFSGFLLPLAFFPPSLQAIANVLPFRAITSIPAQIWLGKIEGIALAPTMLLQLFWIVVLTAVSLVMLRLAMRKVVIQGG